MNTLIVCLALLSAYAVFEPAHGKHILSTYNADGNLVSEDIDEPVAAAAKVDPSQLRYMVYTSGNKATPYELKCHDVSSLRNSPIDISKPWVFLIHGWQGSYEGDAMQTIKDAFVKYTDNNIIMGDYKPYNHPYQDAVANAVDIGKSFASCIDFLVENGLRIKDLQLIGHSLGAHIAGYSANYMKSGMAPRITGLDPAGPGFGSATEDKRLSSGDATFVDVMHTSTAYGMTKAVGTVDYYPNGGQNQPNCKGLMSGGCDHTEACLFYANSIVEPKTYPASQCKTEADARSQNPSSSACSPSSAYMGHPAMATSGPGIYNVRV